MATTAVMGCSGIVYRIRSNNFSKVISFTIPRIASHVKITPISGKIKLISANHSALSSLLRWRTCSHIRTINPNWSTILTIQRRNCRNRVGFTVLDFFVMNENSDYCQCGNKGIQDQWHPVPGDEYTRTSGLYHFCRIKRIGKIIRNYKGSNRQKK